MKRLLKKTWRAMGFLGALFLPLSAMAEEAAWSVGVGSEVYWFDWREYQGGEQLLVESGPLSKANIDLRIQQAQFYTSLAFSVGGGKTHYDGQLQNGTPYESDAWEKVTEAELQLGWQQDWGNLHVGLLQREWDRKIDGSSTVSSAHELYLWNLMTVGGEFVLKKASAWSAGIALDVGKPRSSYQRVYSSSFGNFSLEPGDGYYWRLMLNWKSGPWELAPFVQQQSMDKSEAVQLFPLAGGLLYTIVQPESERIEGGLRLRYVFGSTAGPTAGL